MQLFNPFIFLIIPLYSLQYNYHPIILLVYFMCMYKRMDNIYSVEDLFGFGVYWVKLVSGGGS